MIQYLRHRQIDKKRWDDCIHNSGNGLVYAQSWFLDIVSPGWKALIENDYESIMPLTQVRKYIFPCLIRPNFAQQLGIFSINPVSPEKVKAFLHRIPRKFVWCDYNLNSHNPATDIVGISSLINYKLDLSPDYQEIYKDFNENTRRNLKKALQAGITIEVENEPHTFCELFKIHTRLNPSGLVLMQLRKIAEYSIDSRCGEILIARDHQGQIIAGAFFINALGRLIYLISFSSEEGQQSSAMFMLIDYMIKKYASFPNTLDFEGSMIPGVARFFAGFGAKEITYSRYKYKIVPFV